MAHLLEITCSPSGVVMQFQKSTSHFAWISFKVVRVSLTSIFSTYLPSLSCCCTWLVTLELPRVSCFFDFLMVFCIVWKYLETLKLWFYGFQDNRHSKKQKNSDKFFLCVFEPPFFYIIYRGAWTCEILNF